MAGEQGRRRAPSGDVVRVFLGKLAIVEMIERFCGFFVEAPFDVLRGIITLGVVLSCEVELRYVCGNCKNMFVS